MRYDKRPCVVQSHVPGCTYELCPIESDSPQDGCVDLRKLSVTDFVLDAANAVRVPNDHATPGSHFIQFLHKNFPNIDSADTTLIGHSQGCSVVPYVAQQVSGVTKIIQLAGTTPLHSTRPSFSHMIRYWCPN